MQEYNKKNTILLVDDEDDIREVLSISLADMGYTVSAAQDGKEAIGIFKELNPPIVLTDIKMPGMDGIELLQEIKRVNPDTEVIMITGHGDMDLAIKSLQYEATDFITKPINVYAIDIALKRVHEKITLKQKLKEYTESLETLVREKTELQDHLSSLGLMIGSISHSIKGLLTSLDGGVYMLSSGLRKKDQIKIEEGLDAVKVTCSRIRKMILDILFYTKEREIEKEATDVIRFAHDVADAIEPKIKHYDIGLTLDFDNAPAVFHADADFLRSALINILDNAVDACLEDESKKSNQILFRISDGDTHVIFDINDNGIGMDSDMVESIFELFFSSKGEKGTGFGLFISNNIIKQHGGEISVRSAKGKGSRFTIKIPKT